MSGRNLSKEFMVVFPESDRYACWDDLVDDHDHDGHEFFRVKTLKEARKLCQQHMDRMHDLGIQVPAMQIVGINHRGHPMYMEDIL